MCWNNNNYFSSNKAFIRWSAWVQTCFTVHNNVTSISGHPCNTSRYHHYMHPINEHIFTLVCDAHSFHFYTFSSSLFFIACLHLFLLSVPYLDIHHVKNYIYRPLFFSCLGFFAMIFTCWCPRTVLLTCPTFSSLHMFLTMPLYSSLQLSSLRNLY